MRIAITGATGNVGTSVLAMLSKERSVESIVGISRRPPRRRLFDKTVFVGADVAHDDMRTAFRGADAVVHLAWQIQPSHDAAALRRTNLQGSRRVFAAAVAEGVKTLLYASSVGVYSPGSKTALVDETWPREGIATSTYSRHKVEVERMLDALERDHPAMRVVRMRPALIFKREAASGIRRLFFPPVPGFFYHPKVALALPRLSGLTLQCVHSLDVGRAFAAAALGDARGPFNLAADPVLDPRTFGRPALPPLPPLSQRVLRSAAQLAWHVHLQPTDAGWVDLAFESPLLDAKRAERELGWTPRYDARATLLELLDGLQRGLGFDTPPLAPRRAREERQRSPVPGVTADAT